MLKKLSFSKTLIVIAISAIVISLSSCYPDDDLSYDQTDIVITAYYDTVDFQSLKTYYMSDTVYPVRDDTSDHSLIDANDLIISTIADNMAAFGYTRVSDSAVDAPDVRISAASIAVTNVSVGYWYPYYPGWGWGWGYWKKSGSRNTDYYYPGYPGYYPPGWWGYPYYSSYTTGTLLIEMANPLDYRVIDNDTVTPIYWGGGVTGVLSSGTDNNRIVKGINKAFELSPQIKTN